MNSRINSSKLEAGLKKADDLLKRFPKRRTTWLWLGADVIASRMRLAARRGRIAQRAGPPAAKPPTESSARLVPA